MHHEFSYPKVIEIRRPPPLSTDTQGASRPGSRDERAAGHSRSGNARHLDWGDFAVFGDLEGAFEEMEDVRARSAAELEDVRVATDGA